MKYYELELTKYITKEDGTQIEDGKQTYKLRLTSSNAIALETKMGGKSILDIMGNCSVTTIVKILEYMCKDSNNNFGHKEASSLYDQLVDNGYTLEKILTDVIYECLVHSGFLTKEELVEMMETKEQAQEKMKSKILEL